MKKRTTSAKPKEKTIGVKPTFDHEIITLEKGGAMLFITDLEVQLRDDDGKYTTAPTDHLTSLKQRLREMLHPYESE